VCTSAKENHTLPLQKRRGKGKRGEGDEFYFGERKKKKRREPLPWEEKTRLKREKKRQELADVGAYRKKEEGKEGSVASRRKTEVSERGGREKKGV